MASFFLCFVLVAVIEIYFASIVFPKGAPITLCRATFPSGQLKTAELSDASCPWTPRRGVVVALQLVLALFGEES